MILALSSLLFLAACFEAPPPRRPAPAPPGEDFAQDHTVRITAPYQGAFVEPVLQVEYAVGADIAELVLEADGADIERVTRLDGARGALWVELDEGVHDLRLVGLDADASEVASDAVRVRVPGTEPWVTVASPRDGATVRNPVRFNVSAADDIDRIDVLADGWLLGSVSPGELLTYTFSGTGFERTIDVQGFTDDAVVATDQIRITVAEGSAPGESDFGAIILDLIEDYPTDGSYTYWWPSSGDWGGNPHDIYYLDELFSAGDPQNRSFCVGLTFEVFMRAFEEIDDRWAGDGSLNGIPFEELYDFRTDWYVRDLYGRGIVDAMLNYGIGGEVTDWRDVQAGDFVQFWRNDGSGHNVVFIDWERDRDDEIIGFLYWSTQGSTDGVGFASEYFGTGRSSVDPNHFFVGRVDNPDRWWPWT